MSFEDRIRQAVGRALDDIRTRMEQEVRVLVQEIAARAAEERQLAMSQAREQAQIEARLQADQRVAEAEAHLTATIDRVVADACAREREQATALARHAYEADAETRATRILDAVRALDAAASVDEVLDALAAAIGGEAGRTAVFQVRGAAFHGWSLSGFGSLDLHPERFNVPIAQAPLVEQAIQSGRTAVSSASITGGSMPGAVPSISGTGVAVPLITADGIVAIAYADALTPDGRDTVLPRGWSSTIELLARHGARCLAALTSGRRVEAASRESTTRSGRASAPSVTRAADVGPGTERQAADASASEASARRLARLLIAEIKLHNEPSVDEGRRAGNLLVRLAPQIERARRVYDARVPVALSSRAALFHQELVTTLADGDASRLGVSA